ncbi:MAG: hypothetical protein Q8Q50_10015 [Methylobacter sp.]|nr:hypothetical protein [Methylobacter sp.]
MDFSVCVDLAATGVLSFFSLLVVSVCFLVSDFFEDVTLTVVLALASLLGATVFFLLEGFNVTLVFLVVDVDLAAVTAFFLLTVVVFLV